VEVAQADYTFGTPIPEPNVNSSADEICASISADGLQFYFSEWEVFRPGGEGGSDIWVATRQTTSDVWGDPCNLEPPINSSSHDDSPSISVDGLTLYFSSRDRSGGYGGWDLWQVTIDPVVDLNGDGIVDAVDMCIMIDYWGDEEHSLCDIGPMPWGDGIVDVQDLIILAEHLFEEFPPAEPVE